MELFLVLTIILWIAINLLIVAFWITPEFRECFLPEYKGVTLKVYHILLIIIFPIAFVLILAISIILYPIKRIVALFGYIIDKFIINNKKLIKWLNKPIFNVKNKQM